MQEEKKIKELYGCNYIVSDEKLYPLQKWYNRLLDKTVSHIDVSDVSRMMRQKEFIDLAISKAINFLKGNVFSGDMYEGEILEKLLEVDNCNLVIYSNELKRILSSALEESEKHEWLCKEEKEDFEKVVRKLISKIS